MESVEGGVVGVGEGVEVFLGGAQAAVAEALVAQIIATSPGLEVLDVGCGTGIAARQFQAAGCSVLGVEPDTRMADFAQTTGLPVEVSTFEAWEPGGRTFDTVIAAQSWHWVDPVAGAVKAAQVLRGKVTSSRGGKSGRAAKCPEQVQACEGSAPGRCRGQTPRPTVVSRGGP